MHARSVSVRSTPFLAQSTLPGRKAVFQRRSVSRTSEETSHRFQNRVVQQPSAALSPALSAFAVRTGFELNDPSTLKRALTHKSYEQGRVSTGERLQYIGEKVVQLYVSEYLHIRFPNLPIDRLQAAVDMCAGRDTLARLGRSMGVNHVMRWQPNSSDPAFSGEEKVMSSVVQALVGALYHDKGAAKARAFVHTTLLSKDLDMDTVVKMSQPKRMLSALLTRHGRMRPVSRMIKETGRLSVSPIYVVGVYSGTDRIGVGYGSSVKMAEHRAAQNALNAHFLKELTEFQLPSDTEIDDSITFFATSLGDSTPIL